MRLFYLLLIAIFFTLSACNSGPSPETQLQKIINEKMSKDLNVIGTMEAKYEALFAHYEKEIFGFDDIFIQKALYSIIYGFDIADAKINVEKGDDGILILNVKIPSPREIKEARDRRTLSIEQRFQNYYPKDDNGRKINVSQALDRELQKQLNRHQKQHIEQTRKMTFQYFQALADKYGLKLKYAMKRS